MPRTRKRPCRICRWCFYPDPRAGERQGACSNRECQAVRRQKTQANWRAGNLGYAAAYRIDQRHNYTPDPEPLRVRAPLNQLPWELAKDEFGGKGADFIALRAQYSGEPQKTRRPAIPLIEKWFWATPPPRRKRPDPNPRILKPWRKRWSLINWTAAWSIFGSATGAISATASVVG